MGDLLSEDDALDYNNILYSCVDFLLDRKAALFQPSQKPVDSLSHLVPFLCSFSC